MNIHNTPKRAKNNVLFFNKNNNNKKGLLHQERVVK